MSSLESFHLLRPLWLLALPPTAWLWWRLWRGDYRNGCLAAFCDRHLLPRLWLEQPGRPSRLPLLLLGLGWLLALVALAGPSWQQLPEVSFKTHPARVIVLDLSPAMNAADLPPSRLARARFKIRDILRSHGEGETALIVFAGEPHLVTPLTDDVETIAAMLPALSPSIMPTDGDNAAPALEMAAELLQQAAFPRGDILLLSEGVGDRASTLHAAEKIHESGYRLSVLGVGTDTGAPIPDASGGFGKLSRLDEATLREVAAQGGGRYHRISADTSDIDSLLGAGNALADQLDRTPSHSLQRWVEHGAWLLLPLLVVAAAGYRRGWLGLALLLLAPPPGEAGWLDLWLTPDQQGARLMAEGQPEAAAERFRRSDWRAAALAAAGRHEAAARLWQTLEGAEARYNQGNALARAGRFHEAIAAYAAALALDPGHVDAAANKALLERLLRRRDSGGSNDNADETKKGESGGGAGRTPTPTGSDASEQPRAGGAEASEGEPPSRPERTGANPATAATARPASPTGAALAGEPAAPRRPPRYDDDIALEQWLRQIPDDPAGLLQRKFMMEHLMRKQRR